MPTYLTTFRYAPSTWGRLVEDPVDRAPAVRAMVEAVGGTFHELYYRVDDYGGLVLFDASDATTAAQLGLTALASGAFASMETVEILRSADAVGLLSSTHDIAAGFRRPA